MDKLRQLAQAHERLKHKIHTTKIPLSVNGQRAMGMVYFSVPLICGYFIMEWTKGIAEENTQRSEKEIRNSVDSRTRAGIEIQNQALKSILEDARKE